MSKAIILLSLFFLLFSQPESILDQCSLKDRQLKFDDFKYTGKNKVQDIKVWYNQFSGRIIKNLKVSNDTLLTNKKIKYMWKVIVTDPKGEVKNRKGVPLLVKTYEKLAGLYQKGNNIEMLETVLFRGLKFIPNSILLNKYAAMMYASVKKKKCAIYYFEKAIRLTEAKPKKMRLLVSLYKELIKIYTSLKDSEKVLEICDKILDIQYDEEVSRIKNGKISVNNRIIEFFEEKLDTHPNDYDMMAKFVKVAVDEEEDTFAIKYLKILIEHEPENSIYKNMITRVLYRNENYDGVIRYGRNSKDRIVRKFVIRAYVAKGQFKTAFNIAEEIGKSEYYEGHFFKGQVFEAVAMKVKDVSANKSIEWRLFYRLAYLEYDLVDDPRKEIIYSLLPTKNDISLIHSRLKPNAGKYSNWITWTNAYNREVFGPEN